MTKQEIQALINAKIAGQGSAVDVGGALPAILSGILDMVAEVSEDAVKPVILTGEPDEADTLEDLAEKGLTIDVIKSAAAGKISCFVLGPNRYAITEANYYDDDYFTIAFYYFSYDTPGNFSSFVGWRISYYSGQLSIKYAEV